MLPRQQGTADTMAQSSFVHIRAPLSWTFHEYGQHEVPKDKTASNTAYGYRTVKVIRSSEAQCSVPLRKHHTRMGINKEIIFLYSLSSLQTPCCSLMKDDRVHFMCVHCLNYLNGPFKNSSWVGVSDLICRVLSQEFLIEDHKGFGQCSFDSVEHRTREILKGWTGFWLKTKVVNKAYVSKFIAQMSSFCPYKTGARLRAFGPKWSNANH